MKVLGIVTTQRLLTQSSLKFCQRYLTEKFGGQGEQFEGFEKSAA